MGFLLLSNTGCRKSDSNDNQKDVYTIAVISDIHYMDPSLLPDLDSDPLKVLINFDQRLVVESDAIMREVVQELIIAKPDLVLIPGDLSFDGELVSHQAVAGLLSGLISAGIKVRVINGNHDVNFKYAVKFMPHDTVPVPNIDPEMFKTIYANFGYNDALYTDPASLSYISEPLPGLWLLSIDACKYSTSLEYEDSRGANIRHETMTWAIARLAEAQAKGKTVFGMMHHALFNHFTDQDVYAPGIVVDRSSTVSDSLMNAGLKIMFSGHVHATDITKKTSGNKFLYDIETSSTIVYPCSYRMITYIKDSALIITTKPITHINFHIPSGQTFQDYAKQRCGSSMDTANFYSMVLLQNYSKESARLINPRMRPAAMANMAGDEQILSTSEFDSINSTVTRLGPGFSWHGPGASWRTNCLNIWNDLPPADNSQVIFLKSGNSMKK